VRWPCGKTAEGNLSESFKSWREKQRNSGAAKGTTREVLEHDSSAGQTEESMRLRQMVAFGSPDFPLS